MQVEITGCFKKMQVEITLELKKSYPRTVFGSLITRNVSNSKKHELLEKKKRSLEKKIRTVYGDVKEDILIQDYNVYFNKWGKTYPIEFQIETIKKGGKFPRVSVLVDSMFLAELKNRILTSGHDLDEIQGGLIFDVSKGGERYLKLNGQDQMLKKDDVILKDEDGILASVLYGPARRTAITPRAKNALYFAWCPHGLDDGLVTAHLNDICSNLNGLFESVTPEKQLFRF